MVKKKDWEKTYGLGPQKKKNTYNDSTLKEVDYKKALELVWPIIKPSTPWPLGKEKSKKEENLTVDRLVELLCEARKEIKDLKSRIKKEKN